MSLTFFVFQTKVCKPKNVYTKQYSLLDNVMRDKIHSNDIMRGGWRRVVM